MEETNEVVAITRSFSFESAHNLLNYEGPCQRLHGHRFELLVTIIGEINPKTDMVIDYKDLNLIVKENVISKLDHYYLNDIVPSNTTSERLIYYLWREISKFLPDNCKLYELKLWETENSHATLNHDIMNFRIR